MKHPSTQHYQIRSAFTLMKLLLVLVLTGMIMLAAFVAVELRWK